MGAQGHLWAKSWSHLQKTFPPHFYQRFSSDILTTSFFPTSRSPKGTSQCTGVYSTPLRKERDGVCSQQSSQGTLWSPPGCAVAMALAL